jgi:hypothetical protein
MLDEHDCRFVDLPRRRRAGGERLIKRGVPGPAAIPPYERPNEAGLFIEFLLRMTH